MNYTTTNKVGEMNTFKQNIVKYLESIDVKELSEKCDISYSAGSNDATNFLVNHLLKSIYGGIFD